MATESVQYVMSLQDLATPKIKNAEAAANSFEGSLGGVMNALKGVAEVAAVAFSVEKIYEFGKEILNLTAEFQGFDNIIKYSSIDAKDAQANLDYINDAVKRLHLPLEEATKSFSEMQAGFYGTGIEGEKLRNVFEGVSEAASVLHLMPDQFGRVTFALKEIGELGTVQARQMRMLAFALPGAMNIAAQSMKMNSQQFHEAMHKGEIDSSKFLQNFSAALKEHFQGGLENAGHSLQALMNDSKNAITELELDMGNTLLPIFTHILQDVKFMFDSIKGYWDEMTKSINFNNIGDSIERGAKGVLGWLQPIGAALKPLFGVIYNGDLEIISALSQFGPQVKEFFADLQVGLIATIQAIEKIFSVVYHIIAVTIDVLHTLYVLLDKLGVITVIGKALELVWWAVKKVADLLVWLWDNVLKPIFDKIAQWYDKLKEWLHIKSTADVSQTITQTINAPKATGAADPNFYSGRGKGVFGGGEDGKLGNATSKVTGQKTTTFNIKIDSLVKDFKVETLNMKEGAEKVKDIITQTLLSAVNDSQIVAGY